MLTIKTTVRIIPAILLVTILCVASARPAQASVPGDNVLVSVNNSNGQGGNAGSGGPSATKDGRYVAFTSAATNLVTNDTNNRADVFVRDMVMNTTQRVSVSSSGVQAQQGGSDQPYISANGRYVVFTSTATNLIDGVTLSSFLGYSHIYVHNMVTGTTEMIDAAFNGDPANNYAGEPTISEDGRFVGFESIATNLVSNDSSNHWKIFVKDRIRDAMKLITPGADGDSDSLTMSCDGAFLAFKSYATTITSGDTNGKADIFLDQRIDGDYLTNLTDGSTEDSMTVRMSCNGSYLGITTFAPLVSGDTDTHEDSYLYDRLNNSFEMVNVSSSGVHGNGSVGNAPEVSDDGRYVLFDSSATNLDSNATSGHHELYFRDRVDGTTELLSKNSSGQEGNANVGSYDLTPNAKQAAYQSAATNLIASDTNGYDDVFVAETGL